MNELTLYVQFQVGHARLSEAIVSLANVNSGMMSGHRLVGQRKATNALLSRRHFTFFAMPRDLWSGRASDHFTFQLDAIATFGHDDAVVRVRPDLGFDCKRNNERPFIKRVYIQKFDE